MRPGMAGLVAVACLAGAPGRPLPMAAAQAPVPRASAPAPGTLRVTLLGTGAGPPVRPGRAGVGTLVEAGDERLLFDAGYGVLRRLVETGRPMDAVTRVFLTHLHSDHVVDLPAILLLPWAGPSERNVPLEVWGPDGTRAMMQGLLAAFAADIHLRRDVDEKASARGIEVEAHDIREGVVYDKGSVRVTAFLVDHGPVKPAYGFRVDHAGRSVALSGDTRVSDSLVAAAKGVDVLIHEAVDAAALKAQAPSQRLYEAVVAHHTTPAQAGAVFARVGPRLAVFSHSAGTPAIVEGARAAFDGRLEMGEDLMVIDVGAEVTVTRPAARPR
jgi:ribonuclease Z